jgi:hypothetical protein
MFQSITKSDFTSAFHRMNRGEQFSYKGLIALYDYLEQYEEDTGEQIELDVIAICCEYAEYESLEEFQEDYGEDYESIEDIESETTVIPVDDDGFIILQF